jgi:hypothetical protein
MILGGEKRFVGILRDISEQKAQTEALEYQTLHDVLTSLPNRTLLNDRLHQAILAGSRQRKSAALLIMDVDGFKEVNDTYGHHVGDQQLQRLPPIVAADVTPWLRGTQPGESRIESRPGACSRERARFRELLTCRDGRAGVKAYLTGPTSPARTV